MSQSGGNVVVNEMFVALLLLHFTAWTVCRVSKFRMFSDIGSSHHVQIWHALHTEYTQLVKL